MRFASLGSGSAGNALLVQSGRTNVLLDCGFGSRETTLRLQRLGVEPHELRAIFVTHEHSDHIAGVFKFARRHNIEVCLTHGTFSAAPRGRTELPACRIIDSHAALELDDLHVQPFPVPHDAREPVQYVFSNGHTRLGVLTDTGQPTAHIQRMLNGCDALVLECNHDRQMLMQGPYPAFLKQRVGGGYGHLDNDQAASLLASLETHKLKHIVAAHLSEKNNTPHHVRSILSQTLSCSEDWIGIASQEDGFAWREI